MILAQAIESSEDIGAVINWLVAGGFSAIGAGIMKLLHSKQEKDNKLRTDQFKQAQKAQDHLIKNLNAQVQMLLKNEEELKEQIELLRQDFESRMSIKIDQYTESIAKAASAEASNVELRKIIESQKKTIQKLEKQVEGT